MTHFTHQNPSCTKPQLSHLIQLQGSLVLPPHPAGSFLLPSRARTEQGQLSPARARLIPQGCRGAPGSLPCMSHVSQAVGLLFPATQTLPLTHICSQGRSNSPEGLQAGTSLPAQEQRGTGRDKATWPSSGFFPWSLQCPALLQTPFPSKTRPQKPRAARFGGHGAHFGPLPCLLSPAEQLQ